MTLVLVILKASFNNITMKVILIALIFLSFRGFAQDVVSVPVQDFEMKLDSNQQLLDVRRMDEYNSGHLRGAFQADWLDKKQFEERVQYLDKSKPVYVYCLAGSRSAAAAAWLVEKGFVSVVNLQGGINAWKKEGKPLDANANLPQMTDKDYVQLIHSDGLVLVDFGAEWCVPCKKMEPVLQSFQREHPEIKLVKIDASVQLHLVKKYNVAGLPFFILYKRGKETWRHEGFASKETLENAIK